MISYLFLLLSTAVLNDNTKIIVMQDLEYIFLKTANQITYIVYSMGATPQ